MRTPLILAALLVVIAFAAGCVGNDRDLASDTGATVPAERYSVEVDGSGFHPNSLTLTHGRPAILVLTRTTEATCAKEIVIPALDLRRELPLNEPVELAISGQDKGEIHFACGMDMLSGVLVVN